jgi:uncharacterized ferritin-like protein (DUF455 family)
MELKEIAERILLAQTLEDKLFFPEYWTDDLPYVPIIIDMPTRPKGMHFQRYERKDKLPSFQELHDPEKRAISLHRFATHELQAVELMAYCLLKFPNAPKSFRKGLAYTLKEEQGHVRLYLKRLEAFGMQFDALPFFKHFWAHAPYFTTPTSFVCAMSLTFEQANLDFANLYHKSFLKHGDIPSAQLMQQIVQDEISHVRFGYKWLNTMKEKHHSSFEAYQENLPKTILPKQGKGFVFHEKERIAAGLDADWIKQIKAL